MGFIKKNFQRSLKNLIIKKINLLKEEFQIKFFVGDDALANSFLSIRPAK